MKKDYWILLGIFIFLVILGIIVGLVFVFEKFGGSTGSSGPSGMTGISPCGNATAFDQLCLLNGVQITLTNNMVNGMMGICAGDVLNDSNWCTDVGSLNFVSCSPDVPNSTTWEITRSTDNKYIALQNLATGEFLTVLAHWTSCVPCTFGLGCRNLTSTFRTSLDVNNSATDFDSWFTINIVDLASLTIQLIPSNNIGNLGTDSSQTNSNSCLDMVVANYTSGNPAANWTLGYI